MGAIAANILARLYSTSPFEGFDYQAYPRDLQGGRPSEIMRTAFDAARPQVVLDVGVWKGVTACYWASLMRQSGIDGAVVCVDTWLGAREHLVPGAMPHAGEWDLNRFRKHGYPTLYYQFLANVMHEGLADYIVPIPNTSIIAARWLAAHRLEAQLIFIDASHDEDDVYADLRAYWKLLSPGGVMCGDDWSLSWTGVICAVNRFAREQDARVQAHQNTWAIQKPAATTAGSA